MPIISRFYGLLIKMFFIPAEHNPPHIHAIYGEYSGIIDIKTQKMLAGDLPQKALALVQEWAKLHKSELLQIWDTQEIHELPPLV